MDAIPVEQMNIEMLIRLVQMNAEIRGLRRQTQGLATLVESDESQASSFNKNSHQQETMAVLKPPMRQTKLSFASQVRSEPQELCVHRDKAGDQVSGLYHNEDGDAEPGLDALEEAFQEVFVELKVISQLNTLLDTMEFEKDAYRQPLHPRRRRQKNSAGRKTSQNPSNPPRQRLHCSILKDPQFDTGVRILLKQDSSRMNLITAG
ncbi:hypothetical protein FACUT_5349 [Fusarium acutatum]|uniref:Uncharacterized protein n=1 Tax=Fusarium acutatum TaxID=78861 RepID=A0A8H4JT66_9HYPO|nr:hypothetical protein FACUT_5349 [Fusarium acutatum]